MQIKFDTIQTYSLDNEHMELVLYFNNFESFRETFRVGDNPSVISRQLQSIANRIADELQTRDAELRVQTESGSGQND